MKTIVHAQRTMLSLARMFGVNQQDLANSEVTELDLFDTLPYSSTGEALLTFFQKTNAQDGRTKHDSNMVMSGQLPAPQRFLIEGIEVDFIPGVDIARKPATDEDAFKARANDVASFYQSGLLELSIGAKVFVQNGPLKEFPPTTFLEAANAAATKIVIDATRAAGDPCRLSIPHLLVPGVNFKVDLSWKDRVALPSGQGGRVICRLKGYMLRPKQ
ncbi:hypothetical protein [Leeia sp.]|uniref:hypothetical protein n=1 Tax=Leeia sp. TaxID=2884678 RepID=UPI0035B1E1B3